MSLPTSTSTRPRPPGRAVRRLIGAVGATAVALVAAVALIAPAAAQTSNDFFTGDIPEQGGPAMLSVAGGSIEDLRSAAQSLGVTTVFTTVDGEFIGFAVNAPDFVNQPFRDAFPDGIPQGTMVLIDVPQGGGTNGQPGGGQGQPGGEGQPMTMTANLETINESAQGDQMATGTATFTIDG
ncbi:MAG: hypothetical protein H6674_10300, partial [Dehalococcoidia bacterium]|nr:hypothetical protein [Dehalococcoidia bacterium]